MQKSSLATQDAIWFGWNGARINLSREQVRALIPDLAYFADTGDLPAKPEDK